MADFHTVVNSLFSAAIEDRAPRSVHRLGAGIYHLDYYGDEVYVVTIERVPRVRLPIEPPARVGQVDAVGVDLVQVSYANHVEVVLDAGAGPARDARLDEFWTAWHRWEQRGNIEEPSPSWPGARLTGIAVAVGDDAGTDYRFSWGEAGGMDTPYRQVLAFRPGPPPEAHALSLTFTVPGTVPITVEVPIRGSHGGCDGAA